MGRLALGDKKRVRLPVRIQIRLIDKLDAMAKEKGIDRGKLAADLLERSIKRAKIPTSLS